VLVVEDVEDVEDVVLVLVVVVVCPLFHPGGEVSPCQPTLPPFSKPGARPKLGELLVVPVLVVPVLVVPVSAPFPWPSPRPWPLPWPRPVSLP
jgi:hypothetical protein